MVAVITLITLLGVGSWCITTKAGEKENICNYGGMGK